MVKSLNLSKIHLKTSLLSFIKRIWPFYELNHPSPGFIVFGDKKTRKSFKFSAVFDVPIFWNIACALFVCFRVFFHWCGYLRHVVNSLWCYNSVISAYSVSSPLMNTMRSHLRISKWFSITVLVQTTEVASRIRCNVRHTQYFKFSTWKKYICLDNLPKHRSGWLVWIGLLSVKQQSKGKND